MPAFAAKCFNANRTNWQYTYNSFIYMKYTARASTNLIIDLRGNPEVDINDI